MQHLIWELFLSLQRCRTTEGNAITVVVQIHEAVFLNGCSLTIYITRSFALRQQVLQKDKGNISRLLNSL